MPKPLSASERAAVVDEIGALDAATRPVADKIKRLAALKKQAQAQVAVPESHLVEAVREVLKRHGIA